MPQVQFRPGDYVRFINEKLEGRVTELLPGGRLMVEIEDDFPVEASPSELVRVSVQEKSQVSPALPSAEEAQEMPIFPFSDLVPDASLLLLLIPKMGQVNSGPVQLFIASSLDVPVCFSFYHLEDAKPVPVQSGVVLSGESMSIDWINRSEWSVKSKVLIDLLIAVPHPDSKQRFKSLHLQLNPPTLNQSFAQLPSPFCYAVPELLFQNIQIENDLPPEKIAQLKREFGRGNPTSSHADSSEQSVFPISKNTVHGGIHPPSFTQEIDLHVETFVRTHIDMSSAEILEMQMKRFRQELDRAILENRSSLVFIHGVGDGILKKCIRDELKSMELRFSDANPTRFGVGATEVKL